MSFAPLLGPGSPSYAFVRSSISEYLSSIAALCSSILAATFTSIDNFATRIPPSWCPSCRIKKLWESYSNAGTMQAAPVSSLGTESYILKKLEEIDRESTTTALVLDPNTNICTLKKLGDIDVEKAIFRDILPSSPQSVKLKLPGESKLLSEVLGNDITTRKNRRLKHQPLLVEGIFIIPGKGAGTRTTTTTTDAHEDHLPAELPATLPSVKRKRQQQQPVELPADEISPPAAVIPQAVLPSPPSQPPLLLTPRPRSPKPRKASPLLAPPPPPTRMNADLERKISCASSVGSGSIQIAYIPSH